jgi:sugar (pentulose or hexulose) kinase
MTIALNSVASTPAAQPYVPVVSRTSDASLAAVATSLSATSAVVASLGGSTGVAVYTPAGLLDSLAQAGSLPEPVGIPEPGSDTSQTAQQALDQGVLASLGSSPSTSGVYTGAGTLQSLPSPTSANWADILKANPSLAGTVIADSFNAGLVGNLQVTA